MVCRLINRISYNQKFFKDGETLDDEQLPDFMMTEEMQKAMTTLRQFSEKELEYHQYQASMNYLREQRSIKNELVRERGDKERALADKERALADKEREQTAKEAGLEREQEAARREQTLLSEIARLTKEKQ